jgi:RNA polymerase sigma factor (sigma-70 family)
MASHTFRHPRPANLGSRKLPKSVARDGDGEAFRELTEPYRRELLAHRYRMLASAQDAEDVLQDTMLAAWQNLGSFAERASLRTWLYRIATNRCLNALRSASRQPTTQAPVARNDLAQPTSVSEVTWLEPYPDLLLEGIPDRQPGPEARYEASYRLIETRANGQPAFALYRQDPHAGILHASGLLVITLTGPRVSAMTMFGTSVLARFGLPRTLPA